MMGYFIMSKKMKVENITINNIDQMTSEDDSKIVLRMSVAVCGSKYLYTNDGAVVKVKVDEDGNKLIDTTYENLFIHSDSVDKLKVADALQQITDKIKFLEESISKGEYFIETDSLFPIS